MSKRFHAGLSAILVALLVAAAPAPAAGQNDVASDCYAHGQLTRTYSIAQLRHALQTLPPTVKEYTSCSDVINRALLAQVGSGSGGGSGGGSAGKGSGGSFLPVWLIIVPLLLIAGGGTYAWLAYRRQADVAGSSAGGSASASGSASGPGSAPPE